MGLRDGLRRIRGMRPIPHRGRTAEMWRERVAHFYSKYKATADAELANLGCGTDN
jgi:hypothetical protein